MKRALAASLGLASAAVLGAATPAHAVGPQPCGEYPAGAAFNISAAPTAVRVHYGTRVVFGAGVSRRSQPCEGYATTMRQTPNMDQDIKDANGKVIVVRTNANGAAYYVLTIRRNFNYRMALDFRVVRLSNYGTVRIG